MSIAARIIPLVFCLSAPIPPIDYAAHLSAQIRDCTEAERVAAGDAIREWCQLYGVSAEKVYRICSIETAGHFGKYAYNKDTQARGLMQMTEIALRDIPSGASYFDKHGVANQKKIYNPAMNLRAGIEYISVCESRARRVRARFPLGIRMTYSVDDFSVLLYCMGAGNVEFILSALKYVEAYK